MLLSCQERSSERARRNDQATGRLGKIAGPVIVLHVDAGRSIQLNELIRVLSSTSSVPLWPGPKYACHKKISISQCSDVQSMSVRVQCILEDETWFVLVSQT